MDDLIFAGVVPLLFLAGLVLQVLALWRFDGGWKLAAWVPALAMGAAVAVGVLGGLAGSNLAPIWIFLAAPVCLVWIVALWALKLVVGWLYA